MRYPEHLEPGLPPCQTAHMRAASGPAASDFDRAIELRDGDVPGERWARLDDRWQLGNGVNGGLLMAIAAHALSQELDTDGLHPDPLAVSAYFLSPATPGDLVTQCMVLRAGRGMSSGQVVLAQHDEDGGTVERMRALATFGDLRERQEPVLRTTAAPKICPPDDCFGRKETPDFLAHSSLLHRMDLRLDPASSGWLRGKPSQQGIISGWLRFADGREPDVFGLMWALDAMPPVAFDLGLAGWTPTLEFSAHFRAHPVPGWLQVELSTQNVAGGLMEEDARIWDASGRLVAQSRQLCGYRPPRH